MREANEKNEQKLEHKREVFAKKERGRDRENRSSSSSSGKVAKKVSRAFPPIFLFSLFFFPLFPLPFLLLFSSPTFIFYYYDHVLSAFHVFVLLSGASKQTNDQKIFLLSNRFLITFYFFLLSLTLTLFLLSMFLCALLPMCVCVLCLVEFSMQKRSLLADLSFHDPIQSSKRTHLFLAIYFSLFALFFYFTFLLFLCVFALFRLVCVCSCVVSALFPPIARSTYFFFFLSDLSPPPLARTLAS